MPALVVVPHRAETAHVIPRLSAADRARLASLAEDDVARRRFLAGRTALFAAAARLGAPELQLDARCPDCGLAHGRPTAVGASMPVHLALSHADGRAFAVAEVRPVGVDAESVRTPAERLAGIDALAPGPGDPLRRWTAIEAVLKADGRGLRLPPDAVRLVSRSARLDGMRYRLRRVRVPGCVVAIATAQADSAGKRV